VTLRRQLLEAAGFAPRLLMDSTELVRAFLLKHLTDSGAALDRSGRPDLYYTVFALASLQALGMALPGDRLREWLLAFDDGSDLDFVHAGALARCWAAVGTGGMPEGLAGRILARIERNRTSDGGYDGSVNARQGTAYGAFVALGAWEDLSGFPPRVVALGRSLLSLRSADGAWSNAPGGARGALNATAGAVVLLRQLGLPVPAGVEVWILGQQHASGGFLASPGAPAPDLLSTATALHALRALDARLSAEAHGRCLDFIDTLWNSKGGFHGHWADETLDVEYTFYGLLAAGHLAMAMAMPGTGPASGERGVVEDGRNE
jgi:hypothetical protein